MYKKQKSTGNLFRNNKTTSNNKPTKTPQSSNILTRSTKIKPKNLPSVGDSSFLLLNSTMKPRTTTNSQTKLMKNKSQTFLTSSQKQIINYNNNNTNLDNNINNNQKNNVHVYVRFRPLNQVENNLLLNKIGWLCPIYQDNKVFTLETRKTSLTIGPSYSFDGIFDDKTAQEDIYNTVGKEIVKDVMKGYNGTIFAYGQSGSGKTFTMYGTANTCNTTTSGLIPRIVNDIFTYVQESDDNVKFQLKLSMLQIYKEVIYDLFTGEKDLKIKENPSKGIYVEGLSEVYLSTVEDFDDYLQLAQQNRIVSGTKLNHYSSRSHSIMILEVTQSFTKENLLKKGTLNLVDLAGSEKVSKTGVVGETLEEAKKINLSLSALGNVIHALTSHADHVPYRDSKLTRMLKESLGGNYKTSLIITCSPHSYHLDETISSIQFGQRAKAITNKVMVNIRLSYDELLAMIEKLKLKLSQANDEIKRIKKGEMICNDSYDEDHVNQKESDNQCMNCTLMKERENVLNEKINTFIETIKQKDIQIAQLKAQLHEIKDKQNNDNISTNVFEQLLADIKKQLNDVSNMNNSLITNNNIDVSKILYEQQDKFKQLIKENNSIQIISFFIQNFDKFNSFTANSINPVFKGNYKEIYEQYVDSLKQISKINNELSNKNNVSLFYTYYLYEYIQLYFFHQSFALLYQNANHSNQSLYNINNTLLSIVEDLLHSINELTINLTTQYNFINKNINEQYSSITEENKNSLCNDSEDKKTLYSFYDPFLRRRSYNIHSFISKRNLDIMKTIRCNSNRFSFSSIKQQPFPLNNNTNINNDSITFNDNNYNRNTPNQSPCPFGLVEPLKNQNNSTEKKQGKFKMLREIVVSTIKQSEELKQTIEDMKNEIKVNNSLNRKFFFDLIKGNELLLNKDEDIYFDKLFKANNNKSNLNTNGIVSQTSSDDVVPKKQMFPKPSSIIKINVQRSDKGIANVIESLNNIKIPSNQHTNGNIKPKDCSKKMNYDNLTPQKKTSIEFNKVHNFNAIVNNNIKENIPKEGKIEDFINKYMETGTATRRFDGIKIQYENNQIKCKYAGGLNAENKFELIPIQNGHITQIGGDLDSILNESTFTEK